MPNNQHLGPILAGFDYGAELNLGKSIPYISSIFSLHFKCSNNSLLLSPKNRRVTLETTLIIGVPRYSKHKCNQDGEIFDID